MSRRSTTVPEPGTTGWLMNLILERHDISIDDFAALSGLPRTSLYNWRNNVVRKWDPPLELLQALADLDKTSIAEMYALLDIDVNKHRHRTGKPTLVSYRTKPFLPFVRDKEQFDRAIAYAVSFRNEFMNEARLDRARRHLERAIDAAYHSGAKPLTLYLQTYQPDIYRMMGDLDQAERLSTEILKHAYEIHDDGSRKRDEELTGLGARIISNALKRHIAIRHVARGITHGSHSALLELLEVVADLNIPEYKSGVYEELARVASGLGMKDAALTYVELASAHTFANSHPMYRRMELFLDAGGSLPNGDIDYGWAEDHILSTKCDILISLGRYEDAYRVYRRIRHHKPARSHLSPQNWNAEWRAFVKSQVDWETINDVKLQYSFKDWLADIEESQDVRLQASVLYNQAEQSHQDGNLPDAKMYLEHAWSLATQCEAQDILIKVMAEKLLIARNEGDLPLAQKVAPVLEERIRAFDNPVIQEKGQTALRAI